MREQRSLAGQWEFLLDPQGQLTFEQLQPDRQITVPLPWQAAFPELERYSGYAWYRLEFDVDEQWLDGEVLLHFGAVDYWSQVYINGVCVGEHEGGYTPFGFAIREQVQAGRNTLAVRVFDPVQTGGDTPRWVNPTPAQEPFDARFIPHGKQDWYLNVGGVWQDVKLIAVPKTYIKQVHVTPDIHNGIAQVEVEIAGESSEGTLTVEIDGKSVQTLLVAGQGSYSLTVTLDNPTLWTTETPTLYTATVTLQQGKATDEVSERFGFREIKIQNGQLLLNGEPLILLCALDQDFYEPTIYTVPSEAYLRDQFQKAKELGLNSLRCHIKVPDPLYLDLADEMGLLIWTEIPSWRTFHPKTTVPAEAVYLDDATKERARQTLTEMVNRDYNHPSVIVYSIVNEDWGTALSLSQADRVWVAEMFNYCKSIDPTRLVVDNSPCPNSWGLSIHVKSDLEDFHLYTNIPDNAESFERFTEQFALHPTWTFTNDGLSQRTGHEPLILSEFGNWGMPLLKNIAANGEPDWFKLGPWWSVWDGEPGYPQGVAERFKRFGLDAIWADYDTFAEATQWHQYAALKFEIETLRRLPTISGYVITEFSDIYWESNGLLDFARNPKAYHHQFKRFNAADVIVAKLKRHAYWDDQVAQAHVYLSHYSEGTWQNVQLNTALGKAESHQAVDELKRGGVKDLGKQEWSLAPVSAAEIQNLALKVSDVAGNLLTENVSPVLVLPKSQRQAAFGGSVAVLMRGEEEPVADPIFAELGYQVANGLADSTQLVITDYPTQTMLNWVSTGGDMLFLNSGFSPFFWSHGRGGAYSGNWMTCFSWLRPTVYQRLKVSSPVTMPFEGIMPQHVILGLPWEDTRIQPDILAGQITGWLGHPAAHTLQFRYGQGRVIMTTYRLREKLASHPVAVAMLHDLVDHLTSDACKPVLTA